MRLRAKTTINPDTCEKKVTIEDLAGVCIALNNDANKCRTNCTTKKTKTNNISLVNSVGFASGAFRMRVQSNNGTRTNIKPTKHKPIHANMIYVVLTYSRAFCVSFLANDSATFEDEIDNLVFKKLMEAA